MITKVQPDRQKSESLIAATKISIARLEETDQEKYPSNTLSDYYDIIHKLMESLALEEGVKTRGEGAHQELIDHIAKRHSLSEQIRQFLQQMRNYRNRISYEGFMINKNYIILNKEKINNIIKMLLDISGKHIK